MFNNKYNIYIDESGDEGIKRGSSYFILTAIIVPKTLDYFISKTVQNIKKELNIKQNEQLHWNKIKSYNNKLIVLEKIEILNFTIINIVVDTRNIKYQKSKEIYNYYFGYLLERIKWFLRDNNATSKIFISSRSPLNNTNNIIKNINKNYSKYSLDHTNNTSFIVIANSKRNILQIADVCSSLLHQTLKYNNNIYYDMFKYIKNKIYKYHNKYENYGIKYIPSNTIYPKEIKNLLIFINKK